MINNQSQSKKPKTMRISIIIDIPKGELKDLPKSRAFDMEVEGEWHNNRDIIKALKAFIEEFESPEVSDDEFVKARETLQKFKIINDLN